MIQTAQVYSLHAAYVQSSEPVCATTRRGAGNNMGPEQKAIARIRGWLGGLHSLNRPESESRQVGSKAVARHAQGFKPKFLLCAPGDAIHVIPQGKRPLSEKAPSYQVQMFLVQI